MLIIINFILVPLNTFILLPTVYVVVSLPYSIPQPMKSLPFYILQLSLKNKPLSGEISLKGHYCEYSGIPPYNHPVYTTTSLLRPYSFNPNLKITESFYYFEDPINETTSLLWPGFYGPTEVALTGFHCIPVSQLPPPPKTLSPFFLVFFLCFNINNYLIFYN